MLRVLILRISNFPILGILRQNDIWMQPLWLITNNIARGKVVASPSPGHDEFCKSVYARGSFVHQKCSNHALTNLLFGLWRLVWIISSFDIRPNSHPKVLACLFTPKVLRGGEHTSISSFIVFTFRFTFEFFKKCEGASKNKIKCWCKLILIVFIIIFL